jgi:hypothetical protein
MTMQDFILIAAAELAGWVILPLAGYGLLKWMKAI